ncbi:tetratricopeptide repeat protein [Aurantibacter crassamenti]|uniref:tetratricopeptide repeat protein n=1 Tax=Aurantibacter crassamenti TaxID=1837375 RepID=UPI0019394D39|nr:tetratricopeptide repeat protein [Aurantibacter crassamenti]MBM1106548.1 tetratricopeptide repeat protein [Aurantibacter crassamenti]
MRTSFNSKSIAVLPFLNIGKEENEYFSDGITEEIINALTKIDGLKVTARTSSFFYKNKPLDARKIGNELGVETLLEGSARIINERVRITAQLIRTDNGFHIWSENFDRNLSDIFELQDEISLLIADKIRENFGHFELQEHLVSKPTKNIEAYKLFLKGRSHQLTWNLEDINTAISFYKKSVEFDPLFADAYIGIGWCYGILGSWQFIDHSEGLANAAKYLNKGIALNPESATGHFGNATISFWGNWKYEEGLAHLQKSLESNPKFTEALEAISEIYSALGQFNLAKEAINKALEINPLSPNHYYTKGNIYYLLGHYEKAIRFLDTSLKIDPNFILSIELKTACLIQKNDQVAFREHMDRSPQLERPQLCAQLFDLVNGTDYYKNSIVNFDYDNFQSTGTHLPWSFYLTIYNGNHQKALKNLKNHAKLRTGQYINFTNDPFVKPLSGYDEYKEIESAVFSNAKDFEIKSIKKNQLNTSPFEKEELSTFIKHLNTEMDEDKPFLNPELSLKALAGCIELHPNKLSWLLNNHFGKNFNDFVNQYRIKEFQRLAITPENKNITLLGLAYDSGFNSKTVFNTFFKKETGMTPKQWVKANV